jgi:hypothetical protein
MRGVKFDSPPPPPTNPRLSPRLEPRGASSGGPGGVTTEGRGARCHPPQEGAARGDSDGMEASALEALGSQRKSSNSRRVRELEKQLRRKDKALAEAAALLVLQKNVRTLFGGRRRRHGIEERRMIIELIDAAVASGARREKAAALLGLSNRAVARWRIPLHSSVQSDRTRAAVPTDSSAVGA